MISNRCARKSLVTNCNSIISKNYLRFLVDSNDIPIQLTREFLQMRCKFSITVQIWIYSVGDFLLQWIIQLQTSVLLHHLEFVQMEIIITTR